MPLAALRQCGRKNAVGTKSDVEQLGGRPIGETCSHGLMPYNATLQRVVLRGSESVAVNRHLDGGHSAAVHPHVAVLCYWFVGVFGKNVNQVCPRSVAIGVGGEIFVQYVAESIFAHHLHQSAHHHRSFVVDDVIVNQPRIRQVVEVLLNGGAALSAVLAHGCLHISFHPVKVVVDIWKLRRGDLRCKIVGKHLFNPHVGEPRHSHIVAKPHVSGFVSDERRTRQLLVGRGVLRQEQRVVVVERGTGVLHTAELKSRQHHKLIFCKRIFYAGVFLHPIQRVSHLLEDVVELANAFGVGFAVISPDGAVAVGILDVLKHSGCKSKQIGAEWFGRRKTHCFAARFHFCACYSSVRHRLPRLGHGERQRKRCFHVGLVEARKSCACTVGHKQRVKIVGVAVQRLIAAYKADCHAVFAFLGGIGRDDDMLVGDGWRNGFTVHFARENVFGIFAEVEHHVLLLRKSERDGQAAVDVGSALLRYVEGNVVAHVAD